MEAASKSKKQQTAVPRYNAEQWEQHRALITRLYSKENKRLVDVCNVLLDEHGFHATERTLKHRIRLWHLDKKQKDHEMRAIARLYLTRKAQGKKSIFKIRDRVVDYSEITRYFRRKGIYNIESIASQPVQLSPDKTEFTCHTPEPDEHEDEPPPPPPEHSPTDDFGSVQSRPESSQISDTTEQRALKPPSWSSTLVDRPTASPEDAYPSPNSLILVEDIPRLNVPTDYREMECVLNFTKNFLSTNIAWSQHGAIPPVETDPIRWRNDFLQASYLFRVSDSDLALAEFSSVYDRIPALLMNQEPVFFAVMLGLLCFPANPLDFALTQQMFRYIWNMAQVVLGREHPLTLLLSSTLTSPQQGQLALLALQTGYAAAKENLGPSHEDTLQFLEQLANAHGDREDHAEVIALREQLLDARQRNDGTISASACWALLDLARSYVRAGTDRDDEALTLIDTAIRNAEQLHPGPRAEVHIRGLGRMAFINERQGRTATARMLLKAAIDHGTELLGPEQLNKVVPKVELQKLMERWRPLFQKIRESTYNREIGGGGGGGGDTGPLSEPGKLNVVGLANHLRSLHQGRTISLQRERWKEEGQGQGEGKQMGVNRNLLSIMLIQTRTQSKATA